MKNKLILLILLAVAWFSMQAQDDKLRIAIFDPTSSGTAIDEGTSMAVRELISSVFVNTGKYTIVERALLEKVMNEQAFSNSGAVDDRQASEIGRLAGASKIVLSVVAQAGNSHMISIKIVDVNTATVEQQIAQIIASNQLLDFVKPLTLDMLGETAVYPTATGPSAGQNALTEPLESSFDGIGIQQVMRNDTLYVFTVFSGSPAEKGGLLTGDRIIQVDGQLIAGVNMDFSDIVERLRGPRGTEVRLKVKRTGVVELLELKITRGEITITQPRPVELEMVFVAGGKYSMGMTREQGIRRDWPNNLAPEPVHTVTVSSFYIGKYAVTQAQWQEVMGTTIQQQRDKFDPEYPVLGEGNNYPMFYVSWDEVQEYIRKLNAQTGKNYRLPTEAEWEYAGRGGYKSQSYRYSGSNNIEQVAWYKENSLDLIHPVGTKMANELGIYDMSGNVGEWCNDWFGLYRGNAQTNPKGPSSGPARVVRGGSFLHDETGERISSRAGLSPDTRSPLIGFRLACDSN